MPAALVALAQGPTTLLYVLLIYVGAQFIQDYLLAPLVAQRVVTIPPVLMARVADSVCVARRPAGGGISRTDRRGGDGLGQTSLHRGRLGRPDRPAGRDLAGTIEKDSAMALDFSPARKIELLRIGRPHASSRSAPRLRCKQPAGLLSLAPVQRCDDSCVVLIDFDSALERHVAI